MGFAGRVPTQRPKFGRVSDRVKIFEFAAGVATVQRTAICAIFVHSLQNLRSTSKQGKTRNAGQKKYLTNTLKVFYLFLDIENAMALGFSTFHLPALLFATHQWAGRTVNGASQAESGGRILFTTAQTKRGIIIEFAPIENRSSLVRREHHNTSHGCPFT